MKRDAAVVVPDADTFVLVGPANGEAMARTYLESYAKALPDGIRIVALTPEDNRSLYACDDSRYRMDDRTRDAMQALFTPLVEAEQLQRDKKRIEIGAWTENSRKSHAAGETITFVCKARRALDIATGSLAYDIVDANGKRESMEATFLFVDAMGAAKLSTVVFTAAASSPRGSSSKGP